MTTTHEYRYRGADAHWTTTYASAVLDLLKEGPVLDLGCGNGAMVRQLVQRGLDAYGVDASESGIALARREMPGRFWRLDFESRELPKELRDIRFKAVISAEVIEHLYNPRAMLGFAAEILRDGGTLIITTPYHGYLKNLAIALTGRYDAHHTALWDGGHIKFFSRATLEAMLREAGFKPVTFRGTGRVPFLWKSMVIAATI